MLRILPQRPEISKHGRIALLLIVVSLIYIFVRTNNYDIPLSGLEKTILTFVTMWAIYLGAGNKGRDKNKL